MSSKFHGLCGKSFRNSSKDGYFLRAHISNRNMFVVTHEGNPFLIFQTIHQVKTCSYGMKTSRNIEIKYLFHFKAYFHELDTFQLKLVAEIPRVRIRALEMLVFRKFSVHTKCIIPISIYQIYIESEY